MEGAGAEAGWLASCHEVATPVLLGRGWWAEASHGLTATRRESTVEWVAGEAESLKVRPEFLFTGDVCVDRLSSLLVSSLSFEEMGFPRLGVSDLEKALSFTSPFGTVGRDHTGAESEMAPVWKPL